MLKYTCQYMLQQCKSVWGRTLAFQLRSLLALIASHSQFTWGPFITFWYHATVYRWQYLPAIVGHLPALPVHSVARLCVDCAPGDGQTFFYNNSSASFALRSLLSSCSPAIRRGHTLPINNDLNVFNKRLHTASTPWLPYHHPYPSLLSQLVIQ